MRLLLDECVDWRLLRDLFEFDAKTVRQMGWTGIENGELLALAEREFDVFVTVDKNLSFQQNLAGLRISVLVLRGRSLRLSDLRVLVPKLRTALTSVKTGEVHFIDE